MGVLSSHAAVSDPWETEKPILLGVLTSVPTDGLSVGTESLVKREEKRETPDPPQGVFPLNWSESMTNHVVACMVLKTTASNMRKTSLLPQ
ncbi:hypothetical protein TNCV_2086861 [Trichonephila clavipes]|nr:hypothetical protein TNCV_2086861 [Trichonephila clavipes]